MSKNVKKIFIVSLALSAVFSVFLLSAVQLQVNAYEVEDSELSSEGIQFSSDDNVLSEVELSVEEIARINDAVTSYLQINQYNRLTRTFGVPNWLVAGAINVGIAALTGGGGVSLFISWLRRNGSNAARTAFRNILVRFVATQVANRIAGLVLSTIYGFLSWSIGAFVATIWDRNDRYPRNGYCNAI
ncbi:MAG: hypothetical protein LBV67_12685 [Streptococcaceae bacterium]|jgi:hypothetical protein|nr:hypothetical protein [Streptococcaceae bacterium]